MNSKDRNDRDTSTERLFAMEERENAHQSREDERLAQDGTSNEELSLQNIFIDKGDTDGDEGAATAAHSEAEPIPGASSAARDMTDEQGGEHSRQIPVRHDLTAQELNDAEQGAQVTLTSSDLVRSSALKFGDEAQISYISVDPDLGSIIETATDSWTFFPSSDFRGDSVPVSFVIEHKDGTEEVELTIDVPGTDGEQKREPVASENHAATVGNVDLGSTNEDTSITFSSTDLLVNSTDTDGDELRVTGVSVDAEFGSVSDNGNGGWNFQPSENFNGDDIPLSFTVSDGTNDTTGTAILDVTAVNDGPVVKAVELGATAEDTAITFTGNDLLANASDIDGDELTVTDVSVDAQFGAISDNGDGSWTLNPAEDYNGKDVPLSFTVSDGTATAEGSATLDVIAVNDGPVANAVELGSTQEDTATTFNSSDLLANASDIEGDELSVTSVSVDAEFGSVTDNGDGSWTFSPSENYNADDVPLSFTVSDGSATAEGSATLDITAVNDGPVVNAVELGSTQEDTATTFSSSDLLANASDIDGDELSVTSVSVDAEFGSVTDNADGSWTFNPVENYNGADVPLEFTVTDGTAEMAGNATLDVAAVNDGPTVKSVDLGATGEDTVRTFTSNELLANASDIEGDELSVTSVTVDAEFGSVTDNGDGSWTFSPTENYNGDDVPLSFTVSDGSATAEGSATLDITAVNDGPVVNAVELGSTQEDTATTFSSSDLLANASDIDGDELSVTSVSVDAEFGSLTDNADGSWTFNPVENYNGADVPLEFTVTDGTTEMAGNATLDVAAVNDGPTVKSVDLGATGEDTVRTFTSNELLANASDIEGDELSVTSVTVDAEFGSVTDNGDGSWTFSPTENYNGDDVPLSFTVSDGSATAEGSATLDITAVNDGPVVNAVELGSTQEDTATTFSSSDLLANASDIDGDELSVTSVSVDAEFGSLTDNADGSWTFNPVENYNGADVPLEFTVTDGTTEMAGNATLDVAAVNDGPTVKSVDLGATGEDTVRTFTSNELLANASDIEGDELSVTSVTVDAEFGSVTDNGDGSWSFTPTEEFHGNDVPLNFTVSDGTGTTESTATIDVTEAHVEGVTVVGTNAADTIVGGRGDDNITGGRGNDDLSGGGGDDTFNVYGDAGLDQVDGGEGNDSIVGSRYNETIRVSDNLDNINDIETIDGGAGYDVLQGGSGNDTLDFSNGPALQNIEEIDGGYGDDTIIGTAGNDTIEGNRGNDDLSGGAGDDTFKVYGDAGLDQVDGGEGNDSIVGSRYNETIRVSDNLDNINDIETIDGGAGYDVLQGGSGNDTLDFSNGPALQNIEEIDGGYGDDTIIGTAGNDTIEGNRGNDDLSGGAGDDTFKVYGDAGLDQVDGGEGNDSIVGSRYNETIRVSDNLDNINNIETIDGGAGYDVLQGGSGNDTLDFSNGPALQNIEEIDGGYGDDTIIGTAGNDTIEGNRGNDDLSGGAGDDTFKVYGDAGLDQVDGGEGNDSIVGSRYNETIRVSDNLDNINDIETIDGGAGYDVLQGGSGNDTLDFSNGPALQNIEEIDGGYGDDTIIGTAGNDTIEGNRGNDDLSGGAGDDTFKVYGDAGLDQVDGGEGNDSIVGSRYNETIRVSDNLDNINNIETIDGGAGYDVLQGGSGNDTLDFSNGPALQNIEEIDGGYGDDTIIGTAGNDTIEGNRGNDDLSGGAGDDTFKVYGDAGLDQVDGGEGNDSIVGSRYNDTIRVSDNLDNINDIETIDGGAGYDVLQGGSGNDTLDFSNGPALQNIEEIDGGYGDDTIIGTAGNDTIEGNRGNDDLSGGAGDDTFKVYGDAGLDQVDGGEGNDSIVGSRYNDTIRVSDNLDNINDIETIDGGAGYDVLQGGSGNDTLDFSNGPALQNIEEIDGGYGDDTIIGTAGNDNIDGGHGADTLSGGAGDDALDGGRGSDTLVLNGSRNEYEIVQNEDSSFTIVDSVEGRDGTDTIENFESVEFSDVTLGVDDLLNPVADEPMAGGSPDGEDMLFSMGAESSDDDASGWAEQVTMEDAAASAANEAGWEDGASTDQDLDLAASALDLAPDTNGVITMTEGSDLDSLANLQDSANF